MRPTFVATAAVLNAATRGAGCSSPGGDGGDPRYARHGSYDYSRPDPAYGGHRADRYYVDGPRCRERRLTRNDRVDHGENGRYYCRQNNGTTGLIIGATAGGLIGNLVASGGSETLGTLLGAAGGAVAGRAIDRNNVHCR